MKGEFSFLSLELIEENKLLDKYFSITKPTVDIIINRIASLKNSDLIKDKKPLKFFTKIYIKILNIRVRYSRHSSFELAENKLKGFNYSNIINTLENIEKNSDSGHKYISTDKVTDHLYVFNCNV